MLQAIKRFLWMALLAGSVAVSSGFSLLGPINEAYQVAVIGYNIDRWGDLGAPKNLGEEYRRNTPVMYYTCDANFWDYFGPNGVAEIDKAFGVFNALTNVSSYSNELNEFPFEAQRRNYLAESLYLFDLKTFTMWLIIEQMGLAQPQRYIWCLHDRFLPAGATCPFGEEYLVVKRNFDPVIGSSLDQLKYSSYVNGTLFTYMIPEFCNAPLPPQAFGLPFPVDPDADQFTAVADIGGFGPLGLLPYGLFFQGLTRDDVGGLRYLMRTNNMNTESSGPNTLVEVVNYTPQLLVSSNLTLLAAQAVTNNAATLQTLFPGLVVASSSNYFVNVSLTNVTPYFTNYPWDPIGTPAHIAFATNIQMTVQQQYTHSLANTYLLSATPNGWSAAPMGTVPTVNNGNATVTIETDTIGVTNQPWAPAATNFVFTNTSFTTYQTNAVLGDYVILPTNSCNFVIVNSQLTNVVTSTNILFATNNLAGNIGVVGTTLSYTQSMITYFTNHIFVIYPITCDPTNVALRQGIEKVTFIRRDFDSLLTRFFYPITNDYTLNLVSNNLVYPQKVHRTVVRPDFLLTALDMTAGPGDLPNIPANRRNIVFDSSGTNFVYQGLAGPGIMSANGSGPGGSGIQFSYNKVGPIYFNFGLVNTNAYLQELSQILEYIWGSFDASTNVPTVYPNDVSIGNLENMVLIQITPTYLPDGQVGGSYMATLQTQAATPNWVAPYYWSLTPASPGLPPGLGITTSGNNGLIYGTASTAGTYDFSIRVTDSQGRTVDRSMAIKINP